MVWVSQSKKLYYLKINRFNQNNNFINLLSFVNFKTLNVS